MSDRKKEDDAPLLTADALETVDVPPGVDRRTFLMRSAVIGSAAVIAGLPVSTEDHAAAATAPPPSGAPALSSDLNVVKSAKGPVMTTLEEFYKVGPGPSS